MAVCHLKLLTRKFWLYYWSQFRTQLCYTKPFLLWNVIDTDDFLTCKPFKLRAGQENLSEGFGLGGIVIGNIGCGVSSRGVQNQKDFCLELKVFTGFFEILTLREEIIHNQILEVQKKFHFLKGWHHSIKKNSLSGRKTNM